MGEFLEPCMWETITNLQDVCGKTFEAVAPLSSANIAPWDALTDTIDWSCPTHAFCNQCSDDTEPGGVNRYCVALMLKTSSLYPPWTSSTTSRATVAGPRSGGPS